MVSIRVSLKFKGSEQIFPQETMAESKNRFAPELNELLENATPGSIKKGVFNEMIIPLALVGYEMIIANSALRASLATYHLISNARSWNHC